MRSFEASLDQRVMRRGCQPLDVYRHGKTGSSHLNSAPWEKLRPLHDRIGNPQALGRVRLVSDEAQPYEGLSLARVRQGDIDIPLLFGNIEFRSVSQQRNVKGGNVASYLVLRFTGAFLYTNRHRYSGDLFRDETGARVLRQIKEGRRRHKRAPAG